MTDNKHTDENGAGGSFNSSADFLSFIKAQKNKDNPPDDTPKSDTDKPEHNQDSIASLVTKNKAVESVTEFNNNVRGIKKMTFGISNIFKNVSNGYDAHVRPYVTPLWNWLGKPLTQGLGWLGKATAGNYLKLMRGMAFPKDKESGTRSMSKKGTMGALMTTATVAMALWIGLVPALQFTGKNVIWDGIKLPSERIEYVYTNGVDPVHDGASQAVFYEIPTSEIHPGNNSSMARIDNNMYYGIWPQEAEELAARVPDETGFAVTKEVGWRIRAPWGIINLYPEIVDLSASAVSLLPDGHPGEHGQQVTDQKMADWIQDLSQEQYELYRETNVLPDFLIKHLKKEGLLSTEYLQSVGEQASISIQYNIEDSGLPTQLTGSFNGDLQLASTDYGWNSDTQNISYSYNGQPIKANSFIPS